MPENGKPYVTALYPEQDNQAAESLGRAFINDPTFKAIIPDITDPVERATHLADLFRGMLAIERRSGQPVFGVVDDNGRVVAAALTEGVGHGVPRERDQGEIGVPYRRCGHRGHLLGQLALGRGVDHRLQQSRQRHCQRL